MGSVYVAHDPVLGRMVAIKVFAGDLDLPDARERFSREARAAAALSHPNIVTVYDFGEYDSQPFIVMEYVAGETLTSLIRRKPPVTLSDKLRWMEELCAGAGYAHQMQLVHRDIKPANLILDRSGRLKILDFGIARMLGLASNTAVMIGTPGYMAPEQITGDPVDHRADQFAIGVVFYELLAYTEAFPGETLPMITHRILNEEPVSLNLLAPDTPPELVAIIQRTLRKNAADRFPDSESLRMAIARVRRDASNHAWNLNPTIINRDTPPSPPTASRGTGSARRRQDDAVGVAQLTPPPDPRRTDREALARRRTLQLEAALEKARALFAQGELETALDTCQHALIYDEHHAGALRLEEEIETAIRLRAAAAAVAPASPENLETLWPNLDVRHSEIMTQLDPAPSTPLPGVIEQTVLRLPAAMPDPTLLAPPRKTPSPTRGGVAPLTPVAPPVPTPVPAAPPPSPAPAARAPVAPRSPQEDTEPLEPRKQSTPVKKSASSQIGPAVAGVASKSKGIADAMQPVMTALSRNRRALGIVGIAAAVVVAALVAVSMFRGPAASGTVVIDAAPWGTITAIAAENGDAVALPPSAATPLSLSLPAGTYQVTVTGPPPESQAQQITIEVQQDATTEAPLVRFRGLTAEEYFEQYLAAPTAPTLDSTAPGQAAPQTTPTQSSPVPPPAAGSNP
jgi:hypothetical protein